MENASRHPTTMIQTGTSEDAVETPEKVVKILIVEDDETLKPFWQGLLKKNLGSVDIDWETTEKGAEALLRLSFNENAPYDIVISDIYLKDKDTGLDLWKRFGEAAENFIFVSSMTADKFQTLMAVTDETVPYLQKPLSTSKCRELIRFLLSENSELAKGGIHDQH